MSPRDVNWGTALSAQPLPYIAISFAKKDLFIRSTYQTNSYRYPSALIEQGNEEGLKTRIFAQFLVLVVVQLLVSAAVGVDYTQYVSPL